MEMKEKVSEMWHVTDKQIADSDAECVAKDAEIANIWRELEAWGAVEVRPPPCRSGDKPADATLTQR